MHRLNFMSHGLVSALRSSGGQWKEAEVPKGKQTTPLNIQRHPFGSDTAFLSHRRCPVRTPETPETHARWSSWVPKRLVLADRPFRFFLPVETPDPSWTSQR